MSLLLLLLLELRVGNIEANRRSLDRCGLALELDALGIPRTELRQWVFIARYTSQYSTSLISEPDRDGSVSYGIFQMSDRIWCQSKTNQITSENICKVLCEDLLSDDIKESVMCAQIAKHEMGWTPWPAHRLSLFANPPSIDDCFTRDPLNRTANANPTAQLDFSDINRRIGLSDPTSKREFL